MIDADSQLARLKERIAAIDRKFALRKLAPAKPAIALPKASARSFVENWAEGAVTSNEFGEHFQMERIFGRQKRHGSAYISDLAELPHDLLDVVGENQIPDSPPHRWAFLDTETTGLLGSTGTYAFLIGVGRITPDGFKIRQFFLREYAEEQSALKALAEHLEEFDVLITYNGKTYDQPLLETRYRVMHRESPLGRLAHLDLLHGARRLWKLRMERCRLMQLEQEILGVLREGDLPGEMIPYVYFDYLRCHEAERLVPVFHHNAIDILSLACLSAIVPAAFRSSDAESLAQAGIRRGEDLAGVARWLLGQGEPEKALALFERAVHIGLPDVLLFRTLWDIARLQKKLRGAEAALDSFHELAASRNEYRICALEELAKHYEREGRNLSLALEFTNQAIALESSAALEHRKTRLERRLDKISAVTRI